MAGIVNVWAEVEAGSAQRATRGVEAALSDVSLEMFLSNSASAYVSHQLKDRFVNEGDSVVGQWAQLSQATVAIRQAKGFGGEHPINKRTGELEAYMVQAEGSIHYTGVDVSLVTPDGSPDGELGMKLAMAQGGGTSKWGNKVPKRPVVGIGLEDALALTQLLEVHLETRIATGGIA